jgi:uncharacterized membrane protein YdbT with pleckstrin-like domain
MEIMIKKMESELNFKSSLKIENFLFFFFFSFLFIVLIVLSLILEKFEISYLPIGLSILLSISIPLIKTFITKKFTDFKITNQNEILRNYKFINKFEKVIRIDQITSLLFKQNFFEKLFDLGSFNFGIFGKTTYDKNDISGRGFALKDRFETISNHREIETILRKSLNLENQNSIKEYSPTTSPLIFINLILLFFIGLLFLIIPFPFNFIFGLLFFIICIIFIFEIKRIKSTKYTLTKNYIEYYHNYFLSKIIYRIPLNKITNISNVKNTITYSLFKTGKVKVFTGSMLNIFFPNLLEFENFKNEISNEFNNFKNNKNNISNNLNQNSQIETKKIEDMEIKENIKSTNEKILDTIKAKKSFILTAFFNKILLFFAFGSIFLFKELRGFLILGIIGLIIILIIWFIFNFIYWKNFKYEFYENKLVVTKGFFNIKKSEISYSKIKNIELKRNYFFDKITNQGSILIFTAGTVWAEGILVSVENYDEIYKYIENRIL